MKITTALADTLASEAEHGPKKEDTDPDPHPDLPEKTNIMDAVVRCPLGSQDKEKNVDAASPCRRMNQKGEISAIRS